MEARRSEAKTPAAALQFMEELVPAATAKAAKEAHDIQDVIDVQHGGFQPEPLDWNFYAEQVRKAKYDLDQEEVRNYFELNNVLQNGLFYAASQLYGITFREQKQIPVYNPDIRVFEVADADGKPIALWYCDYFKRDNKEGGAWMNNFVAKSKLLGALPIVYIVAIFTKPAAGQPALISFTDVTTMFHEFGHALHGMFADAAMQPAITPISGARCRTMRHAWLDEHGGLTRANGDRFRKMVLVTRQHRGSVGDVSGMAGR